MVSKTDGVDGLTRVIGSKTRYQVMLMMVLPAITGQVSLNHLLMAFQRYTPKYHCHVSDEWPLNISLPTVASSSGDLEYERCNMYVDPTNHSAGTQACVDGYKFYVDGKEWTVATEWNLVCDRRYLVATVTTVYFAGVMIGGPLFGSVADRVGRKPVILLTMYSQAILGASLYFVYDLVAYAAIRFVQGILIQGMQTCTFSLTMELLTPWFRMVAPLGFGLFWVSGILLLTCICYYVQHWRYIQLFIAIPTLVTVLYIWLIPESLRWLISNGHSRRARAVATRIARYNGLKLSEDVLEDIDKMCFSRAGKTEATAHIFDLFRNSTLRGYALILFYVWFTYSISYFSISFSVSSLSGSRFMNFVYIGLMDICVLPIAYLCLHFMGRRTCLVTYYVLSGLMLIAALVAQRLPENNVIEISLLVSGLVLTGRCIMSRCFGFAMLFTSELFPTVMRTLAMGSCISWTRIGGMLAPQLLLLGEETFSWLPFLILGILSIGAGGLMLLLPETKGCALLDTVNQVGKAEKFSQSVGRSEEENSLYGVHDGIVVSYTGVSPNREETRL